MSMKTMNRSLLSALEYTAVWLTLLGAYAWAAFHGHPIVAMLPLTLSVVTQLFAMEWWRSYRDELRAEKSSNR